MLHFLFYYLINSRILDRYKDVINTVVNDYYEIKKVSNIVREI